MVGPLEHSATNHIKRNGYDHQHEETNTIIPSSSNVVHRLEPALDRFSMPKEAFTDFQNVHCVDTKPSAIILSSFEVYLKKLHKHKHAYLDLFYFLKDVFG